ncbi:MAG: hypothetical protein Greene041639_574, partial [Parcubacteria group bacterium Greene0416_39]
HAKGAAAGNDRHFVQRVGPLDRDGQDRVASFVVGGDLLILVGHHHGAALRTHVDLVFRVLERKKAAQWCSSKGSCFALDRQGVIFRSDDSLGFMRVLPSDSQEPALGGRVLEASLLSTLLEFQKRVEQIDLLKQANIRVLSSGIVSNARVSFSLQANIRVLSSGIVSNARVSFSLSEGWKIFFNPEESLDWQITKLRLVLEKKIPAEKRGSLEYIDVRFGNQAYLKYR